MSQNKLKILVTGATGNIGGAVVKALQRGNYHIRCIARNPGSPTAAALKTQGIEIVKGDYSDYGSLLRAVKDMDTVFAVTTPYEGGAPEEIGQGKALTDAAIKSGVGHFIYSSVASADQSTGIAHFESKNEIEGYIASSALPYTISGPVFVMDNFMSPWYLPALKEGTMKMAVPAQRRLQYISFRNVGEFAQALVQRRNEVFGKRIDIAGDELTGEKTASILSEISGHKIRYESIDPEIFRRDSDDMANMFEWFNKVGYKVNIDRLRQDYPEVRWQTFKDWARQQDWSVLD